MSGIYCLFRSLYPKSDIFVDEDSQKKALVDLLRQSGHDVLTVNEASLQGSSDLEVLNYARKNQRIVLTRNCRDYEALHLNDSNHPGILGIYENMKRDKNMSHKDIIKAIANISAAALDLTNQFIALNHWNY